MTPNGLRAQRRIEEAVAPRPMPEAECRRCGTGVPIRIAARTRGYCEPCARARAARDAIDAIAAIDVIAARDARDASLHRFACWCIHRGWWWWGWDLTWIAATFLGARQIDKVDVIRWAQPAFDAFLSGCWMIFWTADTLYWIAKPLVHVERFEGGRRLHNESYAAVESDVENLYFWHGVLVPAFVVVKPEWITVQHVLGEENAEVRRIASRGDGALDGGDECRQAHQRLPRHDDLH